MTFLILIIYPSLLFSQSDSTSSFKPDVSYFASNVSRTLTLLNTSTPENPKQVRIMVYGQSISEQDWWKMVKIFLEKEYPSAEIIMINKAIGGFSTDRLKLMTENDVISFYPDLILLHDYGNEKDYEKIIRAIKSKTTSEIILQTDHIAVGQDKEWHDHHSFVTLPALAKKYGLAVIDIRASWKDFLEKENIQASDLLSDNVHLNDKGNSLMANIIISYFKELPKNEFKNKSDIPQIITMDLKNKTTHHLTFRGNRVDFIWRNNILENKPVNLKLDNRLPSQDAGCYYYTRPIKNGSNSFLSNMGQLLSITLGENAAEEDWDLLILDVDSVNQQIQYKISGSKTGDDGIGNSEILFTSLTGKIKIEPQSWFRRKNPGDFSQFSWLKPGDILSWKVLSMCKDSIEPKPSSIDTVIQGITNEQHELYLSGEGLNALQEIRIYRPQLVD